uniref:Putative cytoplasmic protein n=1 Tax=uncultured bacterium A1Q1_fos_1870 TaxID=1256554 RepID=L7W1V2_9BACT|nr:putative cytoplasmic protein [uncultured bacterium A1Q1_fos_1870]
MGSSGGVAFALLSRGTAELPLASPTCGGNAALRGTCASIAGGRPRVLRTVAAATKVSPAVRQIHPAALDELKNAYSLEFLSLPGEHSEADLHGALLRHLSRFLAERGRDFCFVGSEVPVQLTAELCAFATA